MDTDLRCNRLTCRKTLVDKAVVTTCSHIFCVECANELFNNARLCPACETPLSERDDVVVACLNPTNDYKTSVLSGLSPTIVLDICNRAISFWQYQIHQENSFQQAVVRNLNDTNAHLQKQLENVVREANGEINILNNKLAELERDLELERRKVRELQDSSRNQDKEYQKLKTHYDKIKRKALLAPHQTNNENTNPFGGPLNSLKERSSLDDVQRGRLRNLGNSAANSVDLGAVVGGMEANGIQRTPLVNRTTGSFPAQQSTHWQPNPGLQAQPQTKPRRRQPFDLSNQSHRAGTTSGSASEVETMLNPNLLPPRTNEAGIWGTPSMIRSNQRVFATTSNKRPAGGFKPAR